MASFNDSLPAAPPNEFCSFCGRARREVQCLVAGPRAMICEACYASRAERRQAIATCSFCRVSGALHGLRAAASETAICDSCLDLVRDILAER